jgi:hypothetical protein
MSLRPVLVSLATLALASSFSSAASADECTGWFCDEKADGDSSGKGEPKAGSPTPGEEVAIPGAIPGIPSDVLSGTITEVVPGDHLTLKLPNGEVKTLKWAELLQLQISGKIVIGGGGAAPAPPPPPAPPTTVVIAPPPPKYLPPPPPTLTYAPPPADESEVEHSSPRSSFKERWTLGLGLALMSPNDRGTFFKNGPLMRDYVGGGTGFEASLGYRISPSWTPYGFYEYTHFRTGAANGAVDSSASASLAGIGMRANTNPDGPIGFYFDLGFGYRWMTVPAVTNASSGASNVQFAGWEYLRLGAGLALNSSRHVSWHIAAVGSAGSFSTMKDGSNSCGKGSGRCEIPEEGRGSYAFGGLAFGGQFDL